MSGDRKGSVLKLGKQLEKDLKLTPPEERGRKGLLKQKVHETPGSSPGCSDELPSTSHQRSESPQSHYGFRQDGSSISPTRRAVRKHKPSPPPIAPKPKLETTFPASEVGSPTTTQSFSQPPKVPPKPKVNSETKLDETGVRSTPPPLPNGVKTNNNNWIESNLEEIMNSTDSSEEETNRKAAFNPEALAKLEETLKRNRSGTNGSSSSGGSSTNIPGNPTPTLLSPSTPQPDGEKFSLADQSKPDPELEETDQFNEEVVTRRAPEESNGPLASQYSLHKRETSSVLFEQVIQEFVKKKEDRSGQLAKEFQLPKTLESDPSISIPPEIGSMRQKKEKRANERSKSANVMDLNSRSKSVQLENSPVSPTHGDRASSTRKPRHSLPHGPDSISIDRESIYSHGTEFSDDLDRSVSGTEDESTEDSEERDRKAALKNEKRRNRLKLITREFITTELTYIETLTHLSEDFPEFIEKCGEKMGTSIMPTNNIVEKLRKEILQLKPLHMQLTQQFMNRVNDWDADKPNFASVLTEYAPMIKMCSNFIKMKSDLALDLIEAQKASHPFAKAVKQFEDQYFKGLRLPDTLDCVHQRVTRYPLLLNTYIGHLVKESEEYHRALEAKRKTEAVAMELEQHLFEGESTKILLELHRRLQGDFSVIEPGRKLLKQGPIIKLSRTQQSSRYLVLFTDVLLYCRPHTATDLLSIVETINIDEITKVVVEEHEEFYHQFSVYRSKHRSFIFIAKRFGRIDGPSSVDADDGC